MTVGCSAFQLKPLLARSSVCFFVSLVAEDISVHQLERLVDLLTFKECEDLLVALSNPEENIFQHIQLLSPENNQLGLQPRAKRDTSTAAG